MDDRFDLPDDQRAELLAYKERLARLAIEAKIAHQESLLPHRAANETRFWRRLGELWPPTSSRRLARRIDQEIANLRRALAEVVEAELAALGRAVLRASASTDDTLAELRVRIEAASAQGARALDEARSALRRDLGEIETLMRFERLARQRAFAEFDRRLALLKASQPADASAPAAVEPEAGAQALLESFYHRLEERFRGVRAEIKTRLEVYLDDLAAARERTGADGPAIDLGCGRGELVELLTEHGYRARGVDANAVQLEAAREHGCDVELGDALAHLRALPDGSVMAVSAIHMAEHLPFGELARLVGEIVRVLRKGGVVILETPNPRNLIVGATTFHLDPTHVRPLPPEVLEVLLDTAGLSRIEVRPLHASDTLAYMVEHEGFDRNVANLLYGPQDYAVIAVAE